MHLVALHFKTRSSCLPDATERRERGQDQGRMSGDTCPRSKEDEPPRTRALKLPHARQPAVIGAHRSDVRRTNERRSALQATARRQGSAGHARIANRSHFRSPNRIATLLGAASMRAGLFATSACRQYPFIGLVPASRARRDLDVARYTQIAPSSRSRHKADLRALSTSRARRTQCALIRSTRVCS